MISNEMNLAFDINAKAFQEMVEIISPCIFEPEGPGMELHHIVPVTWFAQNDSERPNWASISNWANLIRNCKDHPANHPSNLVYLTAKDHDEVHRLMKLCSRGNWEAPKKGAYPPINGVIQTDESGKTINTFASLADAVKFAMENGMTKSQSADWDLRWAINHNSKAWGYFWERG